jgi:carboxypeptidase Taq
MTNLEQFHKKSSELIHLRSVIATLGWDQETHMPSTGAPLRAQQRATLAAIYHERLVDLSLSDLLDELKDHDLTPTDRVSLRILSRDSSKAKRVPETLVRELAETSSLAFEKWTEARKESKFALFSPWLKRIVDLKRQEARCLQTTDSLYEALLDEYEEGMREEWLDELFGPLQGQLTDLLIKIQGSKVKPKSLEGTYPAEGQEEFGREVITSLGFDWKAGRLDRSAHPFCVGLTPQDVRITTRFKDSNFTSSLFGMIHETGHALYEMGLPAEHYGLFLCDSISLGIHESQSRLWENQIGRSFEFWYHWSPRLQEMFPQNLTGLSLEDLVMAVNRVEPSLIRVEADEVTYGLHIILRYEIEKLLLAGEAEVEDLPQLWNGKMEEYLGITPPDEATGVLQDTHWSQGLIGYFPTYLLGNLYAGQLYSQIEEEIPELPERITSGSFSEVREWLREKVHRVGKAYSATELIEKVTGHPLRIDDYIEYLKQKFGELYHL